MRILLKNGRIVSPLNGLDGIFDVLVENGKIKQIAKRINCEDCKIYDLTRMIVVPGLIDMHVHFREPGREDAEDIESGAKAAAKGGFVAVAMMPNTEPPVDDPLRVRFVVERGKITDIYVFPVGSFTKGRQGKELAEMVMMAEEGAVAFSDDGFPVSDPLLLRRGLEYLKIIDGIYLDHAEDRSLSMGGVANESYITAKLGLKGIPWISEAAAVARDVYIAEFTKSKIHIQHVSSAKTLEVIEQAKARGANVTCEVTPHHLVLDETHLETYDTNFKMNPPLRSAEDKEALQEALSSGLIDVIASDHAPHTRDDKEVEFDVAPFGVIGLETTVPVIWDKLVEKKKITVERFVELLSVNPARILGLEGFGKIEKDGPAHITVIDPKKEITVNSEEFASKSRNTPFEGWKLKGAAVLTIVNGKIAFESF